MTDPNETTQQTETDTTTAAPFEFILVKTRVNGKKIRALEEAGIRVVERTDTRTYQIRAAHEAQRGHRHYVRLGERTNATGEKVGDSGRQRISFNPDKTKDGGQPADLAKAMSLTKAIDDVEAIGYRFLECHVMRRPEEPNGMGFLVIVMVLNPPESETMPLTAEAGAMIQDYTKRFYRSVFVFENPDGSCTINSNHSVVGSDLEKATDRRELRFRFEEGRTYWGSAKQ